MPTRVKVPCILYVEAESVEEAIGAVVEEAGSERWFPVKGVTLLPVEVLGDDGPQIENRCEFCGCFESECICEDVVRGPGYSYRLPGFQDGKGMDAHAWEPVDEDTDDTNSGQCVHGVGFDEGCELCDGYRDYDRPEG